MEPTKGIDSPPDQIQLWWQIDVDVRFFRSRPLPISTGMEAGRRRTRSIFQVRRGLDDRLHFGQLQQRLVHCPTLLQLVTNLAFRRAERGDGGWFHSRQALVTARATSVRYYSMIRFRDGRMLRRRPCRLVGAVGYVRPDGQVSHTATTLKRAGPSVPLTCKQRCYRSSNSVLT